MSSENLGQVIQVLGPVIDVEFVSEGLPPINTALKLTNPLIHLFKPLLELDTEE